jgi:biopolymer transport protein ExbD
MAGSSSAPVEDGKKKARIEIIPLIDVIFFLLATFVLFTLSLNKLASLPVDLPAATPPSNTPPDPNDPTVFLNISDQGTCYWKQGASNPAELISTAEIAPRLQDYANRYGSQARVFLQGDSKARFGPAVTALDEIRKVGIKQVSVQTTVQPSGK